MSETTVPPEQDLTPAQAIIGNHPIAAFNNNLQFHNAETGSNPDFQIVTDTGVVVNPLPEPTPELTRELTDRYSLLARSTSQAVGVIEANRFAKGVPAITFPAYSVDSQQGATQHELEQVALQSGHKIIMLENLGIGISDKTNKEQRHSLNEGLFDEVAKSYVDVIEQMGLKEVDLYGFSMGARVAAAVAASLTEHDISVRKLIIAESPGFEEVSQPRMAWRFMVREGMLRAGKYAKATQDPRGIASLDSPIDALKNFSKMIIKDAHGNAGSYRRALGMATIYNDLYYALHKQTEMKLTIISASHGINERSTISNSFRLLRRSFGDRVQRTVLPGDTHSFGTGHARRVGWHIARKLKN